MDMNEILQKDHSAMKEFETTCKRHRGNRLDWHPVRKESILRAAH